MTSSIDPAGGVTAYGYDAAGNMTSLTDPVDRTWAYGYDEQNRQDTVTLPSGDASSTTFDAAGQVTSGRNSEATSRRSISRRARPWRA